MYTGCYSFRTERASAYWLHLFSAWKGGSDLARGLEPKTDWKKVRARKCTEYVKAGWSRDIAIAGVPGEKP